MKELIELLVKSSENFSSTSFIPWWDGDHKDTYYYYNMFEDHVIKEVEEGIGECGKEMLLSPVGKVGLTLFHLLVWHNFYNAVERVLCDGRVEGEEINMPDHKGHGLTPLLLACVRGNLAMTRLLLAHGAKDSVCDERGMNPYHFLAYPRFPEGMLTIDFTCLDHSVRQRGEIARLLNCDINGKDQEGLTPLERLLSTEQSASYTWPLTEVFLEKGAKTDYVDQNGNTLLMMARRNGHKTAAMKLMEQCPEMVNVADKNGVTPIEHAVEYSNQAMYLALIDHGASSAPEMELFPLSQITNNLFCYVQKEDMDGLCIALYMTKKLIAQVDPDDEDEIGEVLDILHNALTSDKDAQVLDICKEAGVDFMMPIHYRGELFCLRDKCLHRSYGIGVVKKLMKMGVDMDQAVVKGRTPARILASMNHAEDVYFEEAAKLFSKESMEELDNSGKAAVHLAAEHGHLGMLSVMIEKGVDINLTEDEPGEAGVTALHLACLEGCVDAVKILMEAGADDTMKTLKGDTPAHFVLTDERSRNQTIQQKAEILKSLKHLDIANEDGRTPLMLLNHRTSELLPVLLERGVDVNHVDNEGMTALMLYTDKDFAKEMIQAGVDINLADNEGNTALHYALEEWDEGCARYLIRKGADYNRPNNQGETPAQIAAEKGFEAVLALMTDIV